MRIASNAAISCKIIDHSEGSAVHEDRHSSVLDPTLTLEQAGRALRPGQRGRALFDASKSLCGAAVALMEQYHLQASRTCCNLARDTASRPCRRSAKDHRMPGRFLLPHKDQLNRQKWKCTSDPFVSADAFPITSRYPLSKALKRRKSSDEVVQAPTCNFWRATKEDLGFQCTAAKRGESPSAISASGNVCVKYRAIVTLSHSIQVSRLDNKISGRCKA